MNDKSPEDKIILEPSLWIKLCLVLLIFLSTGLILFVVYISFQQGLYSLKDYVLEFFFMLGLLFIAKYFQGIMSVSIKLDTKYHVLYYRKFFKYHVLQAHDIKTWQIIKVHTAAVIGDFFIFIAR